MLEITRLDGQSCGPTLKFEGKLLTPWIDEVRRVVAEFDDPDGTPRLDLSAVTFVDAAGAGLLRELCEGEVVKVCSSPN